MILLWTISLGILTPGSIVSDKTKLTATPIVLLILVSQGVRMTLMALVKFPLSKHFTSTAPYLNCMVEKKVQNQHWFPPGEVAIRNVVKLWCFLTVRDQSLTFPCTPFPGALSPKQNKLYDERPCPPLPGTIFPPIQPSWFHLSFPFLPFP